MEDGASEEEASSASDWVEVANVDGAAVVSALAGASELTKEEAATEEEPEAAAEEADEEAAAADEAAEEEAADDAEEDLEEDDSKTEEEAEFPETSWPCSLQVASKASLAVSASPLGHLSSKHCSTFSPMEVQMHSKSAKLLHWEFFSTSATQANKQAGGVAIT